MKKLTMVATILTAFASHGAYAQANDSNPFLDAPQREQMRATELIGQAVHVPTATDQSARQAERANERWESVGDIGDLLISRDGQVGAVLVDIGGFLGVGEREVAIDMGQLEFVSEPDQRDEARPDRPQDYRVVVNFDRETLENAPTYEDPADARRDTRGAMDRAQSAAERTAQRAEDAAERTAQRVEDTAERTAQRVEREADRMTDDRRRSAAGYAVAPRNEQTAENLRGADVWGANDEEIANVADLGLDDQGSVTHILFDVGGFLGVGRRTVQLPIDEVEILWNDEDGDIRVYVPMSEEEIKALPEHRR